MLAQSSNIDEDLQVTRDIRKGFSQTGAMVLKANKRKMG